MQGLFAAFSTLLDAGDEVLLFSPYSTPIVDLIAITARPGSSCRPWRRAVAGSPRRSPRRPPRGRSSCTGTRRATRPATSSRAEETEEVAAFARERGLAVISDEAYEDLVYEGEPSVAIGSLPGMAERTITCFTLSKSYSMTGWRLGYVIRPSGTRPRSRRSFSTRPTSVSTPTQWAGVEALARGTEFVAERLAGYRSRRDRMVAGLQAAGFEIEPPRAALYLFPKTPSWLPADSRAAARVLLDEAKIATVPGIVFGPEGEGHLRFSFSVSEDMIAGGAEALAAYASASATSRP